MSKGASVVAVDSLDEGGPYPRDWKESNVELLRRVAEENEHAGARLLFRELDVGDREAMRAVFFAEEKETSSPPPPPPPTTTTTTVHVVMPDGTHSLATAAP